MAQLPLEIWSLIAGQVYAAGDTKDLLALCLVSRDLSSVASAWLYRTLNLDMNEKTLPLQLLAERMTIRTACHVRECDVSSELFGFDGSQSKLQLKMLQRVVQRLPALRRFKWDWSVSIPNSLLEDLNKIESLVKLDLAYHVALGSEHVLSCSALKGNTKLARLVLHIRRDVESLEGNSNFQECKNMISQAPALKSLAIMVSKRDSDPPTSFSFSPDEALPPLERLVLMNYGLGRGDPNDIENRLDVAKLRTLYLRGVHLGPLNVFIRTLLDTHQIHLRHFNIGRSYKLDSLGDERWHNTLDEFLESFVGLESLVLYGDCAAKLPSLSAITKHGNTLQWLKIHTSQTLQVLLTKPDLGFTAEKLQVISQSCPYLRELAIDLDRGDVEFKERLHLIQQSLRNFLSLRKLDVYTLLCRNNMCLLSPLVDKLYIDDFAARVRSPQLEDLTVWVGDDEEFVFFDRLLSEQLRWENRHKFVWIVKYCWQPSGIKAWHSGLAERDEKLKALAALVGMKDNPPQNWDDYKAWTNELGDSVCTYVSKHVALEGGTGEHLLVLKLVNSVCSRA